MLTAADERRDKCDDEFYYYIRQDNQGKSVCRAFAAVYRGAVKKWGKGAFFGIDPTGKVLSQPQPEYDAAIREFFRKGTPEQFERLGQTKDGKPYVDLGEPLQFDPQRGLRNIDK